MSRAEFMEKLKKLLADIPEAEREEALTYYEDYFDDAGEEKEEEVIASLGSPEKVASTIREGLKDPNAEAGEFTEKGFQGYETEEKAEIIGGQPKSRQKSSDRMKGLGTGGLVLILILAIFALPILGPVLIGIVCVLFGVMAAIVAIIFAMFIVGVALLIAGAAVFASAVGTLFVTPPVAVLLFGAALLLLGIGILLAMAGIWIVYKLLPPMIRGLVSLLQKPFARKEA